MLSELPNNFIFPNQWEAVIDEFKLPLENAYKV